MLYKCECCGYYTLPEKSTGNYNICPVCYWEDDIVQLNDLDFEGGANDESLNQARENFKAFGAISEKFVSKVRKPLFHELPENNITLEILIGTKIKNFIKVYDYNQIITEKGIINIYNPLEYYIINRNQFVLSNIHELNLINTTITNIKFKTKKHLIFEINYKIILKVSLASEDYISPEAISIHFNTGEVLIFE